MKALKIHDLNFQIFLRNKLLVPCTLMLSIFGIIWLQNFQIQKHSQLLTTVGYQKQEQTEGLQLKIANKLPSIGVENVLADWLYLRFIQYFGDSKAREKVGYALSPIYFRQVVNRDPRFVDAIYRLDTATSIFDGNPQKSVALLEQSLSEIPEKMQSPFIPAYYLWIAKGINELLFLGKPEAAKTSYQMAVSWAKNYPSSETANFINRTKQTIAFLDKNPKSRAAQIGAWTSILSTSPDPRTIKRAITEIQHLGGEINLNAEGRLTVTVPPNIE